MSSSVTIGISGAAPDTDSVRAMEAALIAAGATPYSLHDHAARCATTDLSKLDAVVFMGNDYDIDPSTYIERYPEGDPRRCIHSATKSEYSTPQSKARCEYENRLMHMALDAKLPILCVCGGMQRLNVLCGGTLHQHVPDMVGHDKLWQSRHGVAPNVGSIPIIIPGGTRLSMIASEIHMNFARDVTDDCPKVIMENSLRHQSIDIVGKGLRVCSMSDVVRKKDGTADYLIEAVEAEPQGPYAQQFLLGVQWHPEFSASPIGAYIIKHLIAAAQEFAGARGQGLVTSGSEEKQSTLP